MTPQFTGACLITRDVSLLSQFYATVLDAPVCGDATFATVSSSSAGLSIFSIEGMERMAPGSTRGAGSGALTLEFQVNDVDRWSAHLRAAGVPILKQPTTQPWGRRSTWLRDPDGNIVNLYQQVPPPADPATVVRTYFCQLLAERDLSVCEELLAPQYIDHDAPDGTPPGPASTRAYVADMLDDYPDLLFKIHQLVTHDRLVALHVTWSGTHRDSGRALRQTGLLLVRVDGAGRIVERWSGYSGEDSDPA